MRKTIIVDALSTVSGLANAETVEYRALPVGEVVDFPKKTEVPQAIGAHETAPGIFLSSPPGNHYGKRHDIRQTFLFTDAASAKAHRSLHFEATKEHATPLVCLSTRQYTHYSDATISPLQFTLQGYLQAAADQKLRLEYGYASNVAAVRSEQLVVGPGDSTMIHSTLAWVDGLSRGARKIDERQLPVKLVAIGPGGVRVFAMRSPASNTVTFVVYAKIDQPQFAMSRHWPIAHRTQSGHSDCGYARIPLRSIAGIGDSAAIKMSLPIAFTPIDPTPDRSPTGAPLLDLSNRVTQHEVRSRLLRVNMSISQGATDAEPIVTVSFGWDGPERITTAFLPSPVDN